MPAPDTVFDCTGIARAERFDAYLAFMSGGYTQISSTPAWFEPGTVASRCWQIGASKVWHHRHVGVVMSRPARNALSPGNDMLVVSTYLSGGSSGKCEDTPYAIQAGSVVVADLQKELAARSTGPVEMFLVEIPFDLVGYRPNRRHVGQWELQGAGKRMIATNLDLLRRELPGATRSEATVLLRSFAGLVGPLVGPTEPASSSWRGFAEGRAAAMRAYVDANLHRPDLKVAEVGAAVGASRSTVYREFITEGGFERYLTQRRLVMALDELRRTRPRRGLISEVANRWGFADPMRFARSARRIVGVAPSDVVGLASSGDWKPVVQSARA